MVQRRDTDYVMQVPNYIRILALLYDKPSSGRRVGNLGKVLDITNARVCHIKTRLIDLGYLTSRPNGQEVIVGLTLEGRKLAEHCSGIVKMLSVCK